MRSMYSRMHRVSADGAFATITATAATPQTNVRAFLQIYGAGHFGFLAS